MALTYPAIGIESNGILRAKNDVDGKHCLFRVDLDNSYVAGGYVLDLDSAPFTQNALFSEVYSVQVKHITTTANNALPARTTISRVDYVPAASYAPGIGRLRCFHEDAYCCEVEVTAAADLSTVRLTVEVWGG